MKKLMPRVTCLRRLSAAPNADCAQEACIHVRPASEVQILRTQSTTTTRDREIAIHDDVENAQLGAGQRLLGALPSARLQATAQRLVAGGNSPSKRSVSSYEPPDDTSFRNRNASSRWAKVSRRASAMVICVHSCAGRATGSSSSSCSLSKLPGVFVSKSLMDRNTDPLEPRLDWRFDSAIVFHKRRCISQVRTVLSGSRAGSL
ncbi:hypothetical protein HC256_007219 [Beauveria bassiana]|nr:hypothetical protein HC256_007219 [Beauveria bassiana]